MATTTTVLIASGTASAVILAASAVAAETPWETFAAGGAALLITGILVYVLQHTRAVEAAHQATIVALTKQWTEELQQELAAQRTSGDQREAALRELIRDLSRRP